MKRWIREHGKITLILIAVALLMAVGLEVLNQRLLPPIFVGDEVEYYYFDRTQIENSVTYLHPSGRMAYRGCLSPVRIAVLFIMQLTILTVLFPLGWGKRLWNGCKEKGKSVCSALRDKKTVCLNVMIFVGTLGIGFFLVRLWAVDMLGKSNWMIDTFSLCAALALAMLFTFRRTLGKKPEIFFLCFTLLIGGVLAFLLPDAVSVSWDDGYHFWHAAKFSQLGQAYFTQQDMEALEADSARNYALGEERKILLQAQDELNAQGTVYVTGGFRIPPTSFWMATHGLGLFLGRLLHLNYWMTWSMGRFFGLLAYALAGYFAIRRLKSGKMILAATLMIPEAIFLAANYSYDPGVTGLIALGLSYCFVQWQEPDCLMSRKDMAVMLVSLFLGCMIKALYFPVLLIPLFLPKEKFASKKQRKRFLWADIALTLLLIASFMLPFVTGDGTGDQRGGENVNAFAQVQYIFGHPVEFLSVLTHFMARFLDPQHAEGYLTFFAYMGGAKVTVFCQLILATAAFTDRREADRHLGNRTGYRALFELLLLGTITMIAGAYYVRFTAVGADSISGCQPRYLIPLIYPAMMLMGSGKIRNEMNPALYNGLILGAMAGTGFVAVLQKCVGLYG